MNSHVARRPEEACVPVPSKNAFPVTSHAPAPGQEVEDVHTSQDEPTMTVRA